MSNSKYRTISTPSSTLPILNRLESINQSYELINNLLYFSLRNIALKDDENCIYLTLEKNYYYDSICHDFGPPCISQIYRFCKMLDIKLSVY